MTTEQKILQSLPYSEPFRFVDTIKDMSDKSITGMYTFKEDSFFYKGHFINNPVTPGVILLECMGQIGLVCFGIYLLKLYDQTSLLLPVLSNLEADFNKKVIPGETVVVHSEIIYFRNNVLKCKIEMNTSEGNTVCTTKASCKFISEL